MSPLQALVYFVREALLNLRRGWRTSLVAVTTIAVSLFVGGAFLLLGGNGARLVEEWRGEARVILYLEPESSAAEREAFRSELAAKPRILSVTVVSGDEAEARFREFFPRMTEVIDATSDLELPPSLEVELADLPASERTALLKEFTEDPRVDGVDDDVAWLSRLDRGLGVARLLGVVLWLVLALGTLITIASLVRLSAYVYRAEVDIMRLVGATELVIRAPFYLEGLLQGLLGGALGLGGLFAGYRVVATHPGLALGDALVSTFLSGPTSVLLVTAGGLAGLAGALVSIPRE